MKSVACGAIFSDPIYIYHIYITHTSLKNQVNSNARHMLPTFELIPSSQADWENIEDLKQPWSWCQPGWSWRLENAIGKCHRKMEVGGPIPTTENSLSKNITKQDYLAGFIPAPRSFGADGIFTFEVWYGSGMFKIWVVWKIWKGIPKSHVDVLLSASLHCRMSPYFLNHTSGARRAFWGTTSGMHQKQIGVIFCFFWDRMDFCPFTSKKHSSNIRQLCGHTQFVHCSAIAKPGLVRRPDGTSPNCVCRLLLGPYCRSLSFLAASSSIILSKQRHHLGPLMLQSLFCCQSESVWT